MHVNYLPRGTREYIDSVHFECQIWKRNYVMSESYGCDMVFYSSSRMINSPSEYAANTWKEEELLQIKVNKQLVLYLDTHHHNKLFNNQQQLLLKIVHKQMFLFQLMMVSIYLKVKHLLEIKVFHCPLI